MARLCGTNRITARGEYPVIFTSEGRRLETGARTTLDLGWARATVEAGPPDLSPLQALLTAGAGGFTWESRCGRLELTFVIAKKGELGLTARLRGPEAIDEIVAYFPLRQADFA